MKRFVASIFLVFFLAMSFQQLTVLGMYLAQQDFITETFCINKDKPELQCKGKCHMKEMMAQNTETENKEAQVLLEVMIPVYFSESKVEFPSPELRLISIKNQVLFYKDSFESSMFQPPKA